jgi:hypothetical protein
MGKNLELQPRNPALTESKGSVMGKPGTQVPGAGTQKATSPEGTKQLSPALQRWVDW